MTIERRSKSERFDGAILTALIVALACVAATEWRAANARGDSERSRHAVGDALALTGASDAYCASDEAPTFARPLAARRTARSSRSLVHAVARALIRWPQFLPPLFARSYATRVVSFERAQRLYLLFLSLRN